MSAAPWKQRLLSSLAKNRRLPNAKYIQLATVKLDGRPNVRTVVFRGFLNDTDDITMVTDRRSQKVGEVEANPHGQICWYMPNTRQQFRISGQLQLVGAAASDAHLAAARQSAWCKLSDPARAQFCWPHPGIPRSDLSDSALEVVPAPDPQQPVDDFCLLVMRVEEVDLLELKSNRRTLFTLTTPAAVPKQVAGGPATLCDAGAGAAGVEPVSDANQPSPLAGADVQQWSVQELNP